MIETGLRAKLKLANGKVLTSDHGLLHYFVSFDANGEFLGIDVVRDRGGHAAFDSDVWCEASNGGLRHSIPRLRTYPGPRAPGPHSHADHRHTPRPPPLSSPPSNQYRFMRVARPVSERQELLAHHHEVAECEDPASARVAEPTRGLEEHPGEESGVIWTGPHRICDSYAGARSVTSSSGANKANEKMLMKGWPTSRHSNPGVTSQELRHPRLSSRS